MLGRSVEALERQYSGPSRSQTHHSELDLEGDSSGKDTKRGQLLNMIENVKIAWGR